MLRWGQDGLALLSSAENYSTNQAVVVVMLLRGPFVTPQLLQTTSAAQPDIEFGNDALRTAPAIRCSL